MNIDLNLAESYTVNPPLKTKMLYWVFTLLFVLPLLASGVVFCLGLRPAVEGMGHLGYPNYILPFLGVAKILGAIAVLTGRFPRLKEWAYAGFVFDLLGAAYSHLRSGDGPKTLGPLVILFLAALSWFYWRKLRARSSTLAES